MSYYTSYRLTWDGEPSRQEITEHLAKEGEYKDESPQIWLQMLDGDISKWSEYQHDLQGVSARWPNTLFTLHRDGENNNDLAYEYYLCGRVQICPAVITYAEFDPAKLQR